MTQDVIKNISERLNDTIKETNEFFKSFHLTDSGGLVKGDLTQNGARLKSLTSLDFPDKKWVLPFTLPVLKPNTEGTFSGFSLKSGQKTNENNSIVISAPVLSGRRGNLSHLSTVRDNYEPENKGNFALEGWTQSQKRVFFKFAADAENKMRLESLRLQDEYNKQLASKLAMVKNELYESNRKNLVELQEMRVERERWSLDEKETKKNLENVSLALEGLQMAYDNVTNELQDKKFEVSNLNAELANSEKIINMLRKDLETAQKELFDKSELVNRLQKDVADAYLRLEAETSKCANFDSEFSFLNNQRKELEEENKRMRIELDSALLNNQFISKERDGLENRNNKLELQVSDLTKETVNLKNLIRNFEISESSKVKALEEKVNELKFQLKSTQIELSAADKRMEVETLENQVKGLKQQVKELVKDNDGMYRENAILSKKWEQEKQLVKEQMNELYVTKCKVHALRKENCDLRQSFKVVAKLENVTLDLSFLKDEKTKDGKDKRRDLFAPTMFDGPDEPTQEKIDELEKRLTELYLEKDKLESEMIRCNLGPSSPSKTKRQYHVLESKVDEIKKEINKVSGEIKSLKLT